MAKSNYGKICDELTKKIQASSKDGRKSSCSYSRSDLESLALGLLNSPDHVVTEFQMKIQESDGTPVTIDKQPAKRYRDSLKPSLKALGLDKHDVEKIDDIQFSKEHASALMGVATTVMKDYMRAGRKFQFPITSDDEVRMEVYCDTAPERLNQNRFAKSEDEKKKMTKTKKRVIIKAKNNAVPKWLKEDC